MDASQWQALLMGHGMLTGLSAAIHAALSHGAAMGVFSVLVWTGLAGSLRNDARWRAFAAKAAWASALAFSGFAAVVGTGIWVASGTAPPRAPAAMLRLFYWPWLLAWLAFGIETLLLSAGCLLWRTAPRLGRSRFWLVLALPAVGLAVAWLLTGLTDRLAVPDPWPFVPATVPIPREPGLWSRACVRFFGGLALGAILISGLLLRNPGQSPDTGRDFRPAALRLQGLGILVAALAAAAGAAWHFGSPPSFRAAALLAVLTSRFSLYAWIFWTTVGTGLGLVALLALANLAGNRALARAVVIPAAIAAFALTAGFERTREFLRLPGPASEAVRLAGPETDDAPNGGSPGRGRHLFWPAVRQTPLRQPDEAATLFRRTCGPCHAVGGTDDLRHRLAGHSRNAIAAFLGRAPQAAPWMPLWTGNDRQRLLLADYLAAEAARPAPAGSTAWAAETADRH